MDVQCLQVDDVIIFACSVYTVVSEGVVLKDLLGYTMM